ncbi:MAG: dihydroorotase [Parvicellaceae bacterium]
MSSILIKNATIIDPNSTHNNMVKDIFISNGFIKKIDTDIKISNEDHIVISEDNLHASPGLMDFSVDFSEPGNEQKETLISGCRAALAGGFTALGIQPTFHPPRDNKGAVNYVTNSVKELGINAIPYGALSKGLNGEQLSDMYEMYNAGAKAFTDHTKPIKHAGLLSRAILYAKNFNGLIISFPHDQSISPKGLMHEGKTSTLLGLEGIPSLSEELFIERDIAINKYNEGRLHFNIISSQKSISSIAKAKKQNEQISCGTSIYHLIFDDNMLEGFNKDFKMLPPLRSNEDRNALLKGLKDGTIDIITSNHQPHEKEITEVEFAIAPFGSIGTQLAFPLALTYLKDFLGLDGIIRNMSINPRSILQTEIVMVKEGHPADITLFDPTKEWKFSKENNLSLSENTPIIETKLIGKVIGTIIKNKYHSNI